jgi:hypothetical protein
MRDADSWYIFVPDPLQPDKWEVRYYEQEGQAKGCDPRRHGQAADEAVGKS